MMRALEGLGCRTEFDCALLTAADLTDAEAYPALLEMKVPAAAVKTLVKKLVGPLQAEPACIAEREPAGVSHTVPALARQLRIDPALLVDLAAGTGGAGPIAAGSGLAAGRWAIAAGRRGASRHSLRPHLCRRSLFACISVRLCLQGAATAS
jgi:hypothetical protein